MFLRNFVTLYNRLKWNLNGLLLGGGGNSPNLTLTPAFSNSNALRKVILLRQ